MREPAQLNTFEIAEPCPADLAPFGACERSRFCEICNKRVHNLSAMNREEAASLLAREGTSGCFTYVKGSDGTILTRETLKPNGPACLRLAKRLAAVAIIAGMTILTRTSILTSAKGRPNYIYWRPMSVTFSGTMAYRRIAAVRKAVDWAEANLSTGRLPDDAWWAFGPTELYDAAVYKPKYLGKGK